MVPGDDDEEDAEYYTPVPRRQEGAGDEESGGGQLTDKVLRDMVKAELQLFWGKVYDDADFTLDRKKNDPIVWWREHAARGHMRNLAILAISILSIPATSACVERLFSAAKHQITDTRNRLGKERVRQLMFISQNWREELRQLSPDEVQQYNQRHRKREASRQAGIAAAKKARKEAATDSSSGGGGGGGRLSSSDREVQVVAVNKPKQAQGSIDRYFNRGAN
jgi:hypothetical protein